MPSNDNIEVKPDTKKPKYGNWAEDGKKAKLKEPDTKRAVSNKIPNAPEYKTIIDSSTLNQALDDITKIISQTPLDNDDTKINKIKKFLNDDMNTSVKAKAKVNKTALFSSGSQIDGELSVEDMAKIMVDSDLKRATTESARDDLNTKMVVKQHEVNAKMYSVLLRNDSFNKNITSVYYKKSLEYQLMHLMTSRMILDSNRMGFDKVENTLKYIVKNTAMPEYVKTQTFEAIKNKARGRMADTILDGVNSAMNKEAGGDGGSTTSKKTNSKMNTLIASVLGAKMAGLLAKTELGRDIMGKFKTITDDPSTIFRGMAREVGSGSKIRRGGKSALTGVADFLGTDEVNTQMMSMSANLKGKSEMDKQLVISQTEVVPGLLSKMLTELTLIRTGSTDPSTVEEVAFDFKNREFSTRKDINTNSYSGLVNNIKSKARTKADTDLAVLILSNSGMMYTEKDIEKLRVGILSYIASGGLFKNGIPDDRLYGMIDSDLALSTKIGLYNLTGSNNPSKEDNIDAIHIQFEKIKSELPNISKLLDTEVELGNTSALSSAGIITKVKGKYSLNMDKYLELLNSREITEPVKDKEEETEDIDTTNMSLKDKIYNIAKKAGVLGKPIKNAIEKSSISSYITSTKSEIESGDVSEKTISILRENVNVILEKLGLINYIKKDLSPVDLIELFSILDKTSNDKDMRGRVIVYLHSKGIIDDTTLKEAILSDTAGDSSNPMDNMRNTLKGMADVSMIKNLKDYRDSNEPKEEETEDSRIAKIVSAVVDKMEEKKTEDVQKMTIKERMGSWMSRSTEVKSTKIGEKADELANKTPTPAGGGMLGKILSILGLALPAVMGFLGGVSEKMGFIWDIVKNAGSFLLGLGGNIISGVTSALGGVANLIGSAITGLSGLISNGFSLLTNAIGGMLTGIKDFVGGSIDKVKSLLGFETDTPDMPDADKDKTKADGKDGDKDKKKTDGKDDDKDKKKTDGKEDGKDKTKVTKKKNKFGKILGKSAKILAKATVGVGLAVGAKYAVDEFSEGNYGLGVGEFLSGAVGSIPVIGTGVGIAMDLGMDWYRSRNPKIDKNLYDGATYPAMDSDAADRLTLEHIRKHETGTASGKYGVVGDIGDGAGLSFGAYQLTEKSGNLKEYIKRLVAVTNDPTGQDILDNFEGNEYTGNRTGLERFLKETGDTNAGRYVQDSMYKELFLDPAKDLAAQFGITDKASISQIIDHSVNAGMGGAKRVIQRAAGNYSPENIARSRKEDYNAIISSNDSKAKYRDNWYSRVDGNAALFSSYKPDPNTPLTEVNNKGIAETMASNIPNVNPNNQPNTVQANANNMVGNNNSSNGNNQPITNPQSNPYSSSLANNLANYETNTNRGTGGGTSAPMSVSLDVTNLEKLIAISNTGLMGISANTANMSAKQALIIAELQKISTLLGDKKDTKTPPNKVTSFDSKINVSRGTTVQ